MMAVVTDIWLQLREAVDHAAVGDIWREKSPHGRSLGLLASGRGPPCGCVDPAFVTVSTFKPPGNPAFGFLFEGFFFF